MLVHSAMDGGKGLTEQHIEVFLMIFVPMPVLQKSASVTGS